MLRKRKRKRKMKRKRMTANRVKLQNYEYLQKTRRKIKMLIVLQCITTHTHLAV